MRLTKTSLCLLLLLGLTTAASAFSLLGPFKPWQLRGFGGRPRGLGYQPLNTDIGAPMFGFEGYRWNIPTIYYAYDSSFLRYFGSNGVNAVEQAIAILNNLPPFTATSRDLSEFPTDTKGENQSAAVLGLLDLKSTALNLLVEEMGLANPERFVFGLRDRFTDNLITNYATVQMNYDPVTIAPSRYVNGMLYNYRIVDALGPMGGEWASALEYYQSDPLFLPYSSVAGAYSPDFELGPDPQNLPSSFSGLLSGQYFRGLTRDDVGGLRFLYSQNNLVVESLLPSVQPGPQNASRRLLLSPWTPFLGAATNVATNVVVIPPVGGTNTTNTIIRAALRPGLNKLVFRRVKFDALIGGTFTPFTNSYPDTLINPTNGHILRQSVQRPVLAPDIIFAVDDLGTTVDGFPIISARTDTTGWTNNAALNTFLGGNNLGGPGTINPTVVIRFTDLVPYWINFVPFPTDADSLPSLWGSFDGSDTPPVVYPAFMHPLFPELSLQYLQNFALGRIQTN